MSHRPHIVSRVKAESITEYWTGAGWDRDSTCAKSVDFADAISIIIFHRDDPVQRAFGFGMIPTGP